MLGYGVYTGYRRDNGIRDMGYRTRKVSLSLYTMAVEDDQCSQDAGAGGRDTNAGAMDANAGAGANPFPPDGANNRQTPGRVRANALARAIKALPTPEKERIWRRARMYQTYTA